MITKKNAKPIEDQYDLEKQTPKILVVPSRNVSELEFLTGGDVLIERGILEKVQQFKK